MQVVVGLRPDSPSVATAWSRAWKKCLSVVEAASRGDLGDDPAPRRAPPRRWEQEIRDGIAEGNMLLFGHGFSIHYKEIEPPPGVDVGMVAPKGPATSCAGSSPKAPGSPV